MNIWIITELKVTSSERLALDNGIEEVVKHLSRHDQSIVVLAHTKQISRSVVSFQTKNEQMT